MSGPDRIWIDRHGGKWSNTAGGTQDIEFVRRDPAVLAALPEVQALIAGAFEAAATCWFHGTTGMCQLRPENQAAIRALTPAAALAARDAMIAEAVKAARGDLEHPITAYTFAVQHNPNCPSPWLVRMPGKSSMIDMKPYRGFHLTKEDMTGDLLAFGKTFKDAADAAIRKRGEG